LIFIFRRRRKRVEEQEEAGRGEEYREEERVVFRRIDLASDLPRLKKPAQTVFVGSLGGGAGKSFIASNLVIAASIFSGRPVYAVDLDLDNYMLTQILEPMSWRETAILSERARFLTTTKILYHGMRSGSVLKLSGRTFACNGLQVTYEYRLIPAHDIIDRKSDRTKAAQLDERSIQYGLNALVDLIGRWRDAITIIDCKQKGLEGAKYEPVYRVMTEFCDAFLLVLKPPYQSISEILTIFGGTRAVEEKMIIVFNRVQPAYMERVLVLIRDAVEQQVPVFIIPETSSDGELFHYNLTAPAALNFKRRTAIFVLALARFLGIARDDLLRKYGCYEDVKNVLEMHKQLLGW